MFRCRVSETLSTSGRGSARLCQPQEEGERLQSAFALVPVDCNWSTACERRTGWPACLLSQSSVVWPHWLPVRQSCCGFCTYKDSVDLLKWKMNYPDLTMGGRGGGLMWHFLLLLLC